MNSGKRVGSQGGLAELQLYNKTEVERWLKCHAEGVLYSNAFD